MEKRTDELTDPCNNRQIESGNAKHGAKQICLFLIVHSVHNRRKDNKELKLKIHSGEKNKNNRFQMSKAFHSHRRIMLVFKQ